MATRPATGIRRSRRTRRATGIRPGSRTRPAARAAPVGAGLDQALAEFGIPPAALLSKVAHAWEQAIGPAGQRCRLEGISGKALHIVAADPTSASELKWDTPRIVAAVNDAAGEPVAETLRVRVSSTAGEAAATL